jgi:hypothetical protein
MISASGKTKSGQVYKWTSVRPCYKEAAARANLEVLKWAREHGCPWEDEEPGEYAYGDWEIDCCALAA